MEFPRTAAVASRLEVVGHAGSTNADLRAVSGDAVAWPHLSVLLTRDQRAGRGRLDRDWSTPPGAAVAVSVVLRVPELPVAMRGWIPLVAGSAMTDAVARQLPGHDVGVKWPNDVLVAPLQGATDAGGKICGILAEVAAADTVILGAGVNTAMTAAQLPVPTATSFTALGEACDEDLLVADYLRLLDERLSALGANGDAASAGVHALVAARCVTLGQGVRVSLPGGDVLDGRATRLEADGRLVVIDGEGHPHTIGAGDVVHVRPRGD